MRNNGNRRWPIRNGRRPGVNGGPNPLPEGVLPSDMMARHIVDHPYDYHEHGAWKSRHKHLLDGVMGGGPRPIPQDALPIDMHARIIEEYQRGPNDALIPITSGQTFGPGGALVPGAGQSPMDFYLNSIDRNVRTIASTVVLDRGLLGREVTVQTTPTLLVDAQYLRGYIFLNPNESVGLTSAGTILASASRSGTGSSSSLGVANFLEGHFFLDVTVAPGGADTLTVRLEALDPATLNWAVVQDLFSAVTATGTTYSFPGTFGVATDLRVSWEISGAASATFSVGFVLKNGLIGTSSGLSQTIFIGSDGLTTTTGFPLLNGQAEKFYLRENTKLFGIANAPLPIRIFEL